MGEHSAKLLERAVRRMPGGVNSPVRAYSRVGGSPPFIQRAEGAYLWDEDGQRYLDFVLSWGPAILGHSHPSVVQKVQEAVARGSSFGAPTRGEVDLAELVCERVPGLDMVRLVSSGTEACMSAIRLARGATGRSKILKFEGCYHGHADAFLIAAGSGAQTLSLPDSPGVPASVAQETVLAAFNDEASVERRLAAHQGEVAGVIVEPICGNTGCIPPQPGFLAGLRRLCDQHGSLLILDEVMTGFRVAAGGAAQLYGVQPDLFTFGKVLGGGFPLAAYGGREQLMRQIAPDGPIYQAGTLSGNPVAVAAGLETLKLLDEAAYARLEELGAGFEDQWLRLVRRHGYPLQFQRVGSMFSIFFHPEPVHSYADAAQADAARFVQYFHGMLKAGVYLAPSPFEAGFLSLAHRPEELEQTVATAEQVLAEVFSS